MAANYSNLEIYYKLCIQEKKIWLTRHSIIYSRDRLDWGNKQKKKHQIESINHLFFEIHYLCTIYIFLLIEIVKKSPNPKMHCFYIKLNSSSIPRAHSQLLTTQHIYTNPLKKQQSINLSKSPLDYAPFRSPPSIGSAIILRHSPRGALLTLH